MNTGAFVCPQQPKEKSHCAASIALIIYNKAWIISWYEIKGNGWEMPKSQFRANFWPPLPPLEGDNSKTSPRIENQTVPKKQNIPHSEKCCRVKI